jgi:hypothetical protein
MFSLEEKKKVEKPKFQIAARRYPRVGKIL